MRVFPSFPSLAMVAGGALIASPNSAFREQVQGRLNGRCRPVQQALGGADALAKLEKGEWRVLFLDRRVADLDTEELTATIERRFPGIQVVLLDSSLELATAEDERSRWREARPGEHPGTEKLELERPAPMQLALERPAPQRGGGGEWVEPLPGMIGGSQAMQRVYKLARLVAPRSTTVLIAGASGSGKELVARALHRLSPRAGRAFVAVNCAAIPEALLESELFGHARGAFTGALQAQLGRIPAAHGGTLFLDEIGELPLGMQAKLLCFLEEKEVQRLGASEATRVDVRVVAASNVDLAERTRRREFREDLFYRLSAFPLELPRLAERGPDIVPLAEHFLACLALAMSLPCPTLSPEAARILEGHGWPGNVRELQHVMERAAILLESGNTVLPEHLYFPFQDTAMLSGRTHPYATLAS